MNTYNEICESAGEDGFAVLRAFHPGPQDAAPFGARTLFLIGNVGPAMWQRFAAEQNPARDTLDDWTRQVLQKLASSLGAHAVFPFDTPPLPFQRWARAAGAGFISPLGLNVHPEFGLWSAYRAALCFTSEISLPAANQSAHPCEGCPDKPCLSACPVSAFDGQNYDVEACAAHLSTSSGDDCNNGGCLARLACPLGQDFVYKSAQMQFHMRAFLKARRPHL
ncbi:MAG: hypothetical protein ACR2OR_04980 [Hyphomicrobiales bacterium]